MRRRASDAGSFRDPSETVYDTGGRILRTVARRAEGDFRRVVETGLLGELVDAGLLVGWQEVADRGLWPAEAGQAALVLEHPRLPFVSYPYEWSFSGLKAAALLHLDLHTRALERGCTMQDASAYNVQFLGPRPVFIDHLSFRPYRDGEFWLGHAQFCEQFLVPLLLRAMLGLCHNAWYRGAQEGVPGSALLAMLPWYRRWRPRLAMHVSLPAAFERRAAKKTWMGLKAARRRLPKVALVRMLNGLKTWIGALSPRPAGDTAWSDYTETHSYSADEEGRKKDFVGAWARAARPGTLWDVGCNTGAYSRLALAEGAARVIGFEPDPDALETAFGAAREAGLDFLPLCLDAANQSPAQGWNQAERRGLAERGPADGVLALALLHHLCIGRNVPLGEAVSWLVDLAPTGIIEFVPKSDPMVRRMLLWREDIFDGYSEDAFIAALSAEARLGKRRHVTASGRLLVAFERR